MISNETIAYASILAFGTTIVSCWNYVKGFIIRMSTYIVVQTKIHDRGYGINAVKLYLNRNFKRSPFGVKTFGGWHDHVRPKNQTLMVAYEITDGNSVYWKGWKPIWVSMNENKMNISFIRGMFSLEDFMIDAAEGWNSRFPRSNDSNGPTGRYAVNYVFGRKTSQGKGGSETDAQSGSKAVPMSEEPSGSAVDPNTKPLKWKVEDIGPALLPHVRPTELMVLSPEVQEAVDEAIFWKQNKNWYKDRNIPWKRGWLLWGIPGTGKTSLARAVAQELDMPIWVFDLASLTNEELREGWRRMSQFSPCIALLEDIDGTFDGRRNVAVEGKNREGLTFDALLNCIDGVERCDGVLVIVTTNKIDKVDSAIGVRQEDGTSSRPGRIDRVIEMKPPNREGLIRVAKRILDKRPDLWETMADAAFAKGETVCQFQERCCQIALKQKWENFKLRRATGTLKTQPRIMVSEPSLARVIPKSDVKAAAEMPYDSWGKRY
jgi:hypothetical protein